jgi:hypothetical protein
MTTTAGAKLANARAAVREAEIEFAKAGERQADEAAHQRKLDQAAQQKAAQKPTFRMSPQTAASKLVYDCGIASAAERWFAEIFTRLEALEKDSATPPHMRAVEKRG